MTVAPAIVSCPAPGCDYGDGGAAAKFHARSMRRALKMRDDHLKNAHPRYKPPTGSIQSRVPRLD